jgi:hypothetical protein
MIFGLLRLLRSGKRLRLRFGFKSSALVCPRLTGGGFSGRSRSLRKLWSVALSAAVLGVLLFSLAALTLGLF